MSDLSENRPLLRAFINGRLSDAQTTLLLEQLVDDEEALAAVDRIWEEQGRGGANLRVPDLPTDQARRIERRLFDSLRRGDLGSKAIRLGTQGFLDVLLALLRPLLDPSSKKGKDAGGTQP